MTESTKTTITSLWVSAIVTLGLNVWFEGHWVWWTVGLLYLVTALILMVHGGPKPPDRDRVR